MTLFDFTSIADLGNWWDGTGNKAGGGQFNKFVGGGYTPSIGVNHNIDLLYQNLIGRNADRGGRKYWSNEFTLGNTGYKGIADSIKASQEYIDQQNYIAANPNATVSDLMGLDSAYVSPYHANSGSAVAGWRPGDALTASIAAAVTTDPNVVGSNYSDQTNLTVGDVKTATGLDTVYGGTGTPPEPPPEIHGDPSPPDPGPTFPGGGGSGGAGGGYGGGGVWSPPDTGGDDTGGSFEQVDNPYQQQLTDLQKAYAQSQADMQDMWNNFNWDMNRTKNPTVKGVRTQNELPGYQRKKGGTRGFFGRGGRGGGLTTSSLNI